MRAIYDHVYTKVKEVVAAVGLDLYDVDEIVYVGGSASLPGLDETLSEGFSETVITPFKQGTVVGGGVGDPTTILSRGAVLQAKLLVSLPEGTEEDKEVKKVFTAEGSKWLKAKATSKTIGLVFPEDSGSGASGDVLGLGGQWVPVLLRETAVPARRTVRFDVDLGEGEGGEKKVGFEVWEVKEGVKIEKEKPPPLEDEDGEPIKDEDGEDEDEEEEEIEVKDKTVEKENLLTSLVLISKEGKKEKGRWRTKLEVQIVAGEDGGLEVSAWEVGKSGKGEKVSVTVAAA